MKQNKDENTSSKIISNYLSSQIIMELGLNPEQELLFKNETKNRNQYPSPSERIQQKVIPYNVYNEIEPIPSVSNACELKILSCFEVQLQNKKLFAFSIYVQQCKHNCGVVIQDGKYLRYGKIIREIQQNECTSSTSQIILFDENNILGYYIEKQSMAIKLLSNSFIRERNTKLVINDIEMVSYSSRALIRINVNESENPEWNELIKFLISIFSIAIEIHE